jgi:predicted dienelactone hydrolase
MRAGGGGLTTDYTTLAEDLASHGYIVVGFDAPYPSGRKAPSFRVGIQDPLKTILTG